jgi:hypothetical protein
VLVPEARILERAQNDHLGFKTHCFLNSDVPLRWVQGQAHQSSRSACESSPRFVPVILDGVQQKREYRELLRTFRLRSRRALEWRTLVSIEVVNFAGSGKRSQHTRAGDCGYRGTRPCALRIANFPHKALFQWLYFRSLQVRGISLVAQTSGSWSPSGSWQDNHDRSRESIHDRILFQSVLYGPASDRCPHRGSRY